MFRRDGGAEIGSSTAAAVGTVYESRWLWVLQEHLHATGVGPPYLVGGDDVGMR